MQQINNDNGGILMLVGSVFLYAISRFTVQEWASFATIFAALATGAYHIDRIIQNHKNKKS